MLEFSELSYELKQTQNFNSSQDKSPNSTTNSFSFLNQNSSNQIQKQKQKEKEKEKQNIKNRSLLLTPNKIQKKNRWSFRNLSKVELIEKGGFGSLYKAVSLEDNKTYVVKKIPLTLTQVGTAVNEVKAMSELIKCPHICQYVKSWMEPYYEESGRSDIETDTETGYDEWSLSRENLTFSNSEDQGMFYWESGNENKKENENENEKENMDGFSYDAKNNCTSFSENSTSQGDGSESIGISAKYCNDFFSFEKFDANNINHIKWDGSISDLADSENSSGGLRTKNKNGKNMQKKKKNPNKKKEKEEQNFDVVLCIQMEYCKDGDLKKWINERKTIDKKQIKRIFREILVGTNELHKLGMVHRDLKPKNVFLQNGNVKIGDFGLVKFSNSSNESEQSFLSFLSQPILQKEQEQGQVLEQVLEQGQEWGQGHEKEQKQKNISILKIKNNQDQQNNKDRAPLKKAKSLNVTHSFPVNYNRSYSFKSSSKPIKDNRIKQKDSEKDNLNSLYSQGNLMKEEDSLNVGTPIYASPEQFRCFHPNEKEFKKSFININNTMETNNITHKQSTKTDVFSLGIILFELITDNFITEMERLERISRLRETGKIPEEIEKEWQEECNFIRKMLHKNPNKRPSVDQILKSGIFD
ncbi:eukaryotic translation initiation factor 2-alpha kinase eif2-alpha kinase -related [Anaeramoeba flamelloides]|uniref:non-specific serine/threonine protein kinase n=1 Tax=Anaeramoeba flamelloides TaxID=1746091 RepID=A0AAV7ZI24_9EUKA|nr:eukaryotic translation initiation factor 2-alpha kinase eif2-alpha kinase -related [Anaeramoeba flamelloides]